jgi:hypothetical protein
LHADIRAKDIMDGKEDNSSIPEEYKKYDTPGSNHADHYFVSREYSANPNNTDVNSFPTNGLSVLKQASSQLGLNYNSTKIKSIMWNFNGSLINVNLTTGKLSPKK